LNEFPSNLMAKMEGESDERPRKKYMALWPHDGSKNEKETGGGFFRTRGEYKMGSEGR